MEGYREAWSSAVLLLVWCGVMCVVFEAAGSLIIAYWAYMYDLLDASRLPANIKQSQTCKIGRDGRGCGLKPVGCCG